MEATLTSIFLTKDIVQWVHVQCQVSPLTQWTLSMDFIQSTWTLSRVSMDNVQIVHWVHGQCALNLWHCPVYLVSLVFVPGLTGLCPEYSYTLSRLFIESMVNVHWVHGQCLGSPLSPWTFYRRVTPTPPSLDLTNGMFFDILWKSTSFQ